MFDALPDVDELGLLLGVGDRGLAVEVGGVIEATNQALLNYLQRDRSEVLGRPLFQFFMGGSDLQPSDAALKAVVREVVLETSRGTQLIVEMTRRPMRIAGRPAAAILFADLGERQRSELRLAAQYSITRVLADSRTLADGASKILQTMCEFLGWDIGALWLVDPEDETLRCRWFWNPLEKDEHAVAFERQTFALSIARGAGWLGRVWENEKLEHVSHLSNLPQFLRGPAAQRVGLRSGLAVPIAGSTGVHGVLEFFALDVRPIDPELSEMLRAIGSQVGQFVENKQEQDELAQFFLLSPDLFCVAGNDGYFKRLNPAWEAALGWNLEELLGRKYIEFVHPEDRAATLLESAQLAAGNYRTDAFENRYLCKDGSYKHLEWTARSRTDLKRVFAHARDLTSRRQAEDTVREANRFLDSVVEHLPSMLFVKEAASLRFIRFNRAGEELLGRSREEMLGKTDYDLFPVAEAAFFQATDRNVLSGKKLVEIPEEPIHSVTKGERYLRTKKIPLLGEDGEPAYLLGISEDITDWKHAQIELDRLARHNELILNAIGEGIYGVDVDGCLTFINPAGAAMLGWDGKDLVGQTMHPLIHHTKKTGEPFSDVECPIYAAFRDGIVQRVTDDVFWRKDGSSFPVEYVSTPIRSREVTIGAVVAFRDITERQAIDRVKDEFLSVASHELRTPLTSIRGALGVLATGRLGKLEPKGQRMVEVAIESTDRLVRLTNEMLDLERLRSGIGIASKQVCQADALLDQAVSGMRGMALQRKIFLLERSEPLRILAAPDQIIQALTNLLSNAMKFSPPGGTVSATLEARGDNALFAVLDQGRGIPRDKYEAVFERFTQLDASDSRSSGGTGLGLAICRSIVEQHGGRIWVESVVGRGSVFFFTIPLVNT